MLFFYHPEQNSENLNYFRGLLFEQLLKKYLEKLGYEVELRHKSHSLEYDLVGKARLGDIPLIGEAKAHGRSISGSQFSSFVGKLFPYYYKDQKTIGIYLSTSPLTSEADDYRRSLSGTPINLKVSTGDFLLSDICKELGLPRGDTLREAVSGLGVHPLALHYLMTDVGLFLLQISANEDGATPAWFSIMRENGLIIGDTAFLDSLRGALPELSELEPLFPSTPKRREDVRRTEIQEGLILGTEWADYRLPASPEFFVGRKLIVERMISLIQTDDSPGVLQLKSRSGVGKSSLMAFLNSALESKGWRVQLFDTRDLKSIFDIFSVVQRFTKSQNPPSDLAAVEVQMKGLATCNTKSILLFDQFESTFGDPEIFEVYEAISLCAVRYRRHISIVFARKNDLLTTYDNSRISLERLNSVSESILLEDFSADEAVELLDRISKQSGKRVSSDVKTYVLEFAQGFPWLLKRTMAHILRLLGTGTQQEELVPTALRLDDLFDEELEELDEIERDYLVQISRRLPATYLELDRAFDEDKKLPEVLDKLTRSRLLRLSGSTYDTYNDVFKEYLVYKKLPDFRWSFLYRLGPMTVMRHFEILAELQEFTTAGLEAELGIARGSAFNLIRELRNLGLIDRGSSGWFVPELVTEAYQNNRLGELLRHNMLKNSLIADLISGIQSKGPMKRMVLPEYLRDRLLFISATPTTWEAYAKSIIRWLKELRLAEIKGDAIIIPQVDRATVVRDIGNLKQKFRNRGANIRFLPGSYWRHIESSVGYLLSGKEHSFSIKERDALRDLLDLKLYSQERQLMVTTMEELKENIRKQLTASPYSDFWEAVRYGNDLDVFLVERFGLSSLTSGTVTWRRKLLINWGRILGLIPQERTTLKRRRENRTVPKQMSLLRDLE